MYQKLLISEGGGIVNKNDQAEQADNCATIAIGLGGTGIACLRALKREVYTSIQPDADSGEGLPKYNHIKFLAVDGDISSIGDNGSIDAIDTNREFFDISCKDISSLLKGSITNFM